jgi:hypothetical protein
MSVNLREMFVNLREMSVNGRYTSISISDLMADISQIQFM